MKYYKLTALTILILTACIFNASAQEKEGDVEREAGNYQKAISFYHNEDLSSNIALRLAQCYAMEGQEDSAFYYLNFVIEQEKDNIPVSTYESFKEFEHLKKNSEWEKLVQKCKQYQDASEAKLNIPLRDSILEMRRIDNYYQEKFDSILLTNDSILIKSFNEEWLAAVKENDARLTKIIDRYGWPTKELVGGNASCEVFFMAQHSPDVELQKKCLVLLKQVNGKDRNNFVQIAYLEDRVLAKTGRKQLYGTQYKKGKLHPVQDPDNLNKRRAQIGLAPVEFIPANLYYRNLIPNYGFELYSGGNCPRFLTHIDGGWVNVGGESFTMKDGDTLSYSMNFMHICKDQSYFNSCSGNAYIRYWTKDFGEDFIPQLFQVEMKDSLQKGEEYLIEYYIRIDTGSKFALTSNRDVCIFLLKNKYKITTWHDLNATRSTFKGNFKISPDFSFYENSPVEDFSEWTKVTNKYVAKGGEKYFLIGLYGISKYNCGISLDDITVQKVSGNTIRLENAKIGEAIVLENIWFETNSSKLTEASYPGLNSLVECFNTYPGLKVEIAGHTDNIGNKEDNIKLSENRAKSVAGYLISAGVEPSRVQAKGYGESVPISDNTTEKGREKNRRVEFKILQR